MNSPTTSADVPPTEAGTLNSILTIGSWTPPVRETERLPCVGRTVPKVRTVVPDDGTVIAYSVLGSGRPVLLIHGFPDDHTLWGAQAEAIATAGMQAVPVDQRGFGKSGKPDDPTAYRAHLAMADMIAVLDDLGHESAAVVGHDWGAAVASSVAMFAPDRVERLVLISAGHPGSPSQALSQHRSTGTGRMHDRR